MGVDKLQVLEGLFDQKRISVLRLFLGEPKRKFYLREIAKLSGVPPATTYRILGLLSKLGLVEEVKINRFKLYQLKESETTKFLETFLKEQPLILDVFVKKVSQLDGVEQIMQHGKAQSDKANILIIGSGVDQGQVKLISAGIKEQFDYKISSLSLEREQFEQMSSMGLYSGVKKTLFRR